MKKIASFIGFGTLIALATGFLFLGIYALTILGNVFDLMGQDAGYGFVTLMQWIVTIGVAVIFVIFAVIEIIKMIPVFKGKTLEEKSMNHAVNIGVLGNGFFFGYIFFIFIQCGILKSAPGGRAIIAFIFASSGVALALLAFLVKPFAPMLKVIFYMVAIFLDLVVGFMFFEMGGLFLVFLIFNMIGLFGALAYVLLANLDAFKK